MLTAVSMPFVVVFVWIRLSSYILPRVLEFGIWVLQCGLPNHDGKHILDNIEVNWYGGNQIL